MDAAEEAGLGVAVGRTARRYGCLEGLTERRRSIRGDDLLSAMLDAEEGGERLSHRELVASTFLLLFAGHETTVNLIATGTLELVRHPEAMEQLRARPALGKTAVEELLRFTSPAEWTSERYTREPVTYDDRLLLRLGEERAFVRVRDIVVIEADGDGSTLRLAPHLARKSSGISLREWEQRLPDRQFVRIHRSTIVNLEYVERLEPWSHASQHVHLRGLPEAIAMSRLFGARLGPAVEELGVVALFHPDIARGIQDNSAHDAPFSRRRRPARGRLAPAGPSGCRGADTGRPPRRGPRPRGWSPRCRDPGRSASGP
jgi:DNA-binding LytR/AlgR family response regulator